MLEVDGNRWMLDGLRSPVIELCNSCQEDGVLTPGRLFFDRSYFAESGAKVIKNEHFLAWANEVFVLVKKTLNKISEIDALAGDEALRMYKNDNIFFVDLDGSSLS